MKKRTLVRGFSIKKIDKKSSFWLISVYNMEKGSLLLMFHKRFKFIGWDISQTNDKQER